MSKMPRTAHPKGKQAAKSNTGTKSLTKNDPNCDELVEMHENGLLQEYTAAQYQDCDSTDQKWKEHSRASFSNAWGRAKTEAASRIIASGSGPNSNPSDTLLGADERRGGTYWCALLFVVV